MKTPSLWKDLIVFITCLFRYFNQKLFGIFWTLEESKSRFASQLYQKRGKYAQPFVHSGMAILVIAAVILGPVLVAENNPQIDDDFWQAAQASSSVFSPLDDTNSTYTFISEKPRAEIIEYQVVAGDTLSSIAQKFQVSVDTVLWENELESVQSKIKPGLTLRILPTTGVLYHVKRGDTVYSIAEKYDVSAQTIVDWPYNTFVNDETFALAVGQILLVPDGIMPKKKPVTPRPYLAQIVPQAGQVTGTGAYAWPVGGRITQNYSSWHRGIDIANKDCPGIAAADSGTVIVAGWPQPWAFGNRVIIDHGGGRTTLYGHLSAIYVNAGDQVSRGQLIGKMGSTGRSTGPHLHFEIRQAGVGANPFNFLK